MLHIVAGFFIGNATGRKQRLSDFGLRGHTKAIMMVSMTALGRKTAGGTKRHGLRGAFALAMLTALAACQTGTDDVLQVQPDDVITEADLQAYCPPIILREGTAFFQTYTDGNDGNADEIVYQASIKDQTRTCRYRNGQLQMTVAVAGRVVNGPKGNAGTVDLPIRVAVTQGDATAYSDLGNLSVAMVPGAGAQQFLYSNDRIVLPEPSQRNLVVYIGFDEGPYDTP